MLSVEMRPTADVGKCAVKACGLTQVLVVTAGDQRLVICEQCYQDLVEGAAKVGVHIEDDGYLESEIDRLEEEVKNGEGIIDELSKNIAGLEDRVSVLCKENEKLKRQIRI